MSVRRDNPRFSLGLACFAALLAGSLMIAALLSAAPGVHERLHRGTAPSGDLCLVTLFASGQCESVTPAQISAPPNVLPVFATLPAPPSPSLSTAHFFSLLEHAPPSFA
jgi:hypothetical protein